LVALGSKPRRFGRIRRRDALVQLAVAALMVLQCRDILVAQHRSHPHVRLRHRRDAAFFEGALRFQVIAKSIESLLEIPMLPGSPSLLRDEESMLDGVSRDARLSCGSQWAGRARGVTPIGFESALGEGERAAPDTGNGGGDDTDGAGCHSACLLGEGRENTAVTH
jgi:hypothetical protein